jgi:thioredoxin 1
MEIKSKEELEEVIKTHDKVIIDFWAIWCAPCKMFAPQFEDLSKEYASLITFIKINVGENEEIAKMYNITSVPTIAYFSHGIEIKREKALVKEAVVNSIKSVF